MGNLPKFVIMKSSVLFLALTLSSTITSDIDPLDDISEEEFRKHFHLRPITDPKEFAQREQALKEHEAKIKEVNQQYQRGEKNWFAKVNDFADLPDELFMAQKTGLVYPEDDFDQVVEKVADSSRHRRSTAPESFSAVDLGLVTPAKHQLKCGSCSAFTATAAIETCFAKLTGHLDDYAEQQLIDCAYGNYGAKACDGAYVTSYLDWTLENDGGLAHESIYPYLNTKPNLVCPKLDDHKRGAKLTNYSYIRDGNEELLKSLVFEHGAAIATVHVNTNKDLWNTYGGEIFDDCTVPEGAKHDHGVTVVGYGNENGLDYWLIKNSWGKNWGKEGFMKLKRGVGMCGIGKEFAIVTCEKVAGPTDPTLTTAVPCIDQYPNCPELAKEHCYKEKYTKDCIKSCGLCEGMTPAASYTCYDSYGSICIIATKNDCLTNNFYADGCRKTCGLCNTMVP